MAANDGAEYGYAPYDSGHRVSRGRFSVRGAGSSRIPSIPIHGLCCGVPFSRVPWRALFALLAGRLSGHLLTNSARLMNKTGVLEYSRRVMAKTRRHRGRLILGVAVLAVLTSGCTAAANTKPLQQTEVPSSAASSLPSVPVRLPAFQRGVDIDAYTYPGQDIAAAAAADVAYIKSLYANSVSISFPFFMTGPSSSAVYAMNTTPSPAQVAVLVNDAEAAGLYVSIRPLLDESTLGRSRAHWSPDDTAAWFSSYQRFLLPYAAMAQREKVPEFIVGTELSIFQDSPHWNALDKAFRRTFHGALGCSNNWGSQALAGDGSGEAFAGNCGDGVRESVDAYQPQNGNLLAGWEAYDSGLPRGTAETEVGIDAVAGAYKRPYQHEWAAATSLDASVQAHWFTAACRAAVKERLGGIYFWALGFSNQPATGPTVTYQGQWAGGAGGRAIAQCFKTLQEEGK
jgi:hypothetical protein